MSWVLLALLALVTIASRVLPMVLLPVPRGRIAGVLDALPAPLFAALAAHALVGVGAPPSAPALLAAGAALVGAIRKSLALTLAFGISGFLLGQTLTG
ncbi:MAG: AzlD domain-containing protein [Acidimicrobiia bacterium]